MVVAVQRPRREESDLDKVLKGLQVVSGFLNVKNQLGAAERLKAQEDRQAKKFEMEQEKFGLDKAAAERAMKIQEMNELGLRTPGQIMALEEKGFRRAIPGEKGAFNILEAPPVGQEGPPQQLPFLTPQQQQMNIAEERFAQQQNMEMIKLGAAERERAAKRGEARRKEKQTLERQRRDGFKRDSRKAIDDLANYRKAEDLMRQGKISGIADYGLINLYMRTLSPGIVTEAEVNQTIASGGASETVQGYLKNLMGKGKLTNEQRQEILNSMRAMARSRTKQIQGLVRGFRNIAKDEDLNFDKVVFKEERLQELSNEKKFNSILENINKQPEEISVQEAEGVWQQLKGVFGFGDKPAQQGESDKSFLQRLRDE